MRDCPSDQDSSNAYRAIFSSAGLPYGQCFGGKGTDVRRSRATFFVANSSIVTREGLTIWRGDLDLASERVIIALIAVARRLNRALFILREQTNERVPPGVWLTENALVRVWRGRVMTIGTTRRMFGSLGEVIARYRARDRVLAARCLVSDRLEKGGG